MKKKNAKPLLLCMIVLASIAVACTLIDPRQRDLARYAGNATCLGYSSDAAIRSYMAPIDAQLARMALFWHESSSALVISDAKGSLHTFSEELEWQTAPVDGLKPRIAEALAFAKGHSMLAVSMETDGPPRMYVYSLEQSELTMEAGPINRAGYAVWHPSRLLLAARFFPEGYEAGTNIVQVIDVSSATPELVDTYVLKDSFVVELFGWSASGAVFAASQFEENGLTPQYIFVDEDAMIKGSLFSTANHSCVADGQWAPNKQIFAFSGVNETMEGWDIFLETVTPAEDVDRSLVNLTDSPREDELGAAWSPNGEQIAYSKTYEDVRGHFRQELFLIHLNDDAHRSVQLTDTADEYETDPTWISDREIAYLSWNPVEGSWSLNILSTSEATPASGRLMEIPPSWYWDPQVDSDR